MWIITTSASKALIDDCHATLDLLKWCKGIYFFGEVQKTAIVAINQLPTTPDTLWLRLLGKKTIRTQAIDEIFALPNNHPLRNDVLDLIFDYLSRMEKNPNPTEFDKEFIMELSADYVKWREDTLQRGRLEMQQIFLENLLKFRFGKIDEVLAQIVELLLKLSPEESSQLILQLFMWYVEINLSQFVCRHNLI